MISLHETSVLSQDVLTYQLISIPPNSLSYNPHKNCERCKLKVKLKCVPILKDTQKFWKHAFSLSGEENKRKGNSSFRHEPAKLNEMTMMKMIRHIFNISLEHAFPAATRPNLSLFCSSSIGVSDLRTLSSSSPNFKALK